MNAFKEKITRGCSLKAIQAITDKIKRMIKGYNDVNAPSKKPAPKNPVKKMKVEMAIERANAITAKPNDCLFNLYIAIANKNEQINKGRKKTFPKTTEIIKDTIPIRKNIKYIHHLSLLIVSVTVSVIIFTPFNHTITHRLNPNTSPVKCPLCKN